MRCLQGPEDTCLLALGAPEVQRPGMFKECVFMQLLNESGPVVVVHTPELDQALKVTDEPVYDLRLESFQVHRILERVNMNQQLLYGFARLVGMENG